MVGVAGLLGALANLDDTQVDGKVLEGLAWLKKTDLITRWEQDAKGMPIDYMGSKFGGPGHRGLSAGHDVGRFFNALNQVRTGTFEGIYREYGERFVRESTMTPYGTPYAQVEWPLALAQLLKHWVADFVTPMSLPLPGWTLLRGIPDREPQRTEMLFAAHAAAGAVSLSRTAAAAVAGQTVVDARHVNVPVLMRVGMLALKVRSDAATRAGAAAPDWADLLGQEAATWTLPGAISLTGLIADPGPEDAD